MKRIILASASPRRQQLLASIVTNFDTISSNVNEEYPTELDLTSVPLYLSNLKAYDVHTKYPNDIVIGSDTAIIFENKIFGKPKNKKDAKAMLSKFSNNCHLVVTGVTIYNGEEKHEINSISKVYFKQLTEKEIDDYLAYDEYKDKAGSYAIQGLASKFIEKIEGEYEAIVGLPLKDLSKLLNKLMK